MKRRTIALSLLLVLGLTACKTDDGDQLTQTSAVSDCGGFAAAHKSPIESPGNYCDAELLLWQYTPATQKLNVANNRVYLNCCGDHSMEVTVEDGVYVFTETDAPQASSGGARCGCMCVFDYTLEVAGLPEGEIPIRIVRNVTDDEAGPQTVYTGTLDLTAGSGSVVTDDTTSIMGCGTE